MEKCTYCVQRIQAVKIDAKNESIGKDEGPVIKDGTIQTACQQVCPTQAIQFGDLADQKSQVTKDRAADRAYAMLSELNIKPRTGYLAKIRNPNPALEDAEHEHDRHSG
jgi:molybdopterin-containing oxidoreductase family iron-sulfur binding subunit